MNPIETFFAAGGGRQGLIDTAIKSVTGDTDIIILENKKILQTTIGEWINKQLDDENNKPKIQYHDASQMNMEMLDLEENQVYIPTCDEDGNTSWGNVVSITRHDPGNELYEVETESGRKVIVTASKSLIVWNSTTKKLKEKLMTEITTEDYVPITMNLCRPPVIKSYARMSKYLPKNEYVYGTEFNKAVKMMNNVMNSELTDGAVRHLESKGITTFERTKVPAGWWESVNGKEFTLPYTKKSSLQRATVRSKVGTILINKIIAA